MSSILRVHTHARVCVPRPIYFLFFNIVVIHIFFFFLIIIWAGQTNPVGRANRSQTAARPSCMRSFYFFLFYFDILYVKRRFQSRSRK